MTKELMSILTTPQKTSFLLYLKSRNKRNDQKNTLLFKSVLDGTQNILKSELGSNAFNVLKSRLNERLVDFISTSILQTEVNNEIEVLKLILISQKLFTHLHFKAGYKLLNKAYIKAELLSDYTLLNEIHHTYIQYSYHELSPEQNDILKNFEANQKLLLSTERINMANAKIRKAFNNNSDENLGELIQSVYNAYKIENEIAFNFKSLFQLAEMVDIIGAVNHNYFSANLFFVEKTQEIEKRELDSEKHLIYHVDLLYIISNIYFRKRDFKNSFDYLSKMHDQMSRLNLRPYNERKIQYDTLLALNYNYTGEYQIALDIVNKLIELNGNKFNELGKPLLLKSTILFQQNNFREALKVIISIDQSDKVIEQKDGLDWLLHKKYVEILIHIELGNIDLVESKINSLMKKYGAHLKRDKNGQIIPFLKLIKTVYNNPFLANKEEFKIKVDNSINWKPQEQEDIFLMSFYAWLKSKMENRPLYQTMLELITPTK